MIIIKRSFSHKKIKNKSPPKYLNENLHTYNHSQNTTPKTTPENPFPPPRPILKEIIVIRIYIRSSDAVRAGFKLAAPRFRAVRRRHIERIVPNDNDDNRRRRTN